jgi:hypothetical protein
MSTLNKQTVEKLEYHRDMILDHLESIRNILFDTEDCESEYPLAFSHYIPQIITALKNDKQFLPRGEYNLQNTLDNLKDKLESLENTQKGVKKYIF